MHKSHKLNAVLHTKVSRYLARASPRNFDWGGGGSVGFIGIQTHLLKFSVSSDFGHFILIMLKNKKRMFQEKN